MMIESIEDSSIGDKYGGAERLAGDGIECTNIAEVKRASPFEDDRSGCCGVSQWPSESAAVPFFGGAKKEGQGWEGQGSKVDQELV